MPDSLTIKLQKELEKRGRTASLTQIDSFLDDNNLKKSYRGATNNETVWDMLNTGRADELFAGVEQPGEGDFSPTRMAGVALWNFLDVGSLGLIPGLLDPKDILEKKAMPQNFSERVAGSLGGLAGFIPTFGFARGIAKAGVAKYAPKGIGNISKSIKAKTVSTLKNDDAVKKYWNEYAKTNNIQVGGKEYTKAFDDFVGTLVDYPTAKLTTLNSKFGTKVLGTEKGRAEFLKSLQDNVPESVEIAMKKHADLLKIPGLSKKLSDGLLEEAFNISSKSIKNYKLPTLNLQNVLADKWGSGRLANLGASAFEEAILFSAVEVPMNMIKAHLEDDVQLDLGGTLKHSFLLGSALGLFRYIPGGKGIPISSTVYNRVKQAAGKKRRYSRYDTSKAADRLALGTHLKTIASSRKDITKSLRRYIEDGELGGVGTKIFSSGGKVGQRINKLVETPEGAAQVQKLLVSLEDAFVKKWWPGFLKEVPGDIIGSLGRMTAVALAFNYTTYKQWLEDGSVPLEDIIFHTGLAAVLGKKGKQLTYSVDGVHHISEKNRPYQYSEDFKKVDEFLNTIQVNPQSSLFTAMMNDYNAINTSLTQIDLKSNDMKMFHEIAKGKDGEGKSTGVNIIVSEKDFKNRKPAKGKTPNDVDEVFDHFAAIIQGQFLEPGQRILESHMLTKNQIKKVLTALKEHEFEGLKEFRAEGQTAKGVVSTMDLYNIALESSAVKHRLILKEYKDAVIQSYNAIQESLGDPHRVVDIGGEPIEMKKINFREVPDESVATNASRLAGFENAINLLVRRGEIKILGVKGAGITVTKDIQDIILGRRAYDKDGNVEVIKEGELDRYEDSITKIVMGDAQHDITRKIIVGDDIIDSSIQTVIFRDNVRDTWGHIKYLMDGKFDSSKPYFKKVFETPEALARFSEQFKDIFYKNGTLATDIVLTKGKGNEQVILNQETMGTNELRLQEFARSVLRALRMDVSGKRVGGGFGTKHYKNVNISEVAKIYKEFRKANITGFHLPTDELRQDFASHLEEYSFESSMASMTKNDGSPLTVTDRAVLGVMLESNILSSKYTIPNLKGFIENVENVDQLGNALKNIASFKTLLSSMKSPAGHKFSEETRIFIESVNEASKSANISPITFIKELKVEWEKTIAPFMKIEGKGGFINTSGTKAVVQAKHLVEVMELIKNVKEIQMESSHSQLMEATKEASDRLGKESIDSLKGKFLKRVQTVLHGSYGDSHRALTMFKDAGIYKDGFFRFSEWFEKDKAISPKDMLRALEQRIAFNFNKSYSETAYERLHKIHADTTKEITDLTKGVSKSLDGFLKDYSIEVPLQPGDTASKIFRNDPKMEKAVGFVTNMIERATIKFTKAGEEIEFVGQDGFLELGKEKGGDRKQLQFVQEAVNVFGTLKHGREVQKIHSTQGTLPTHTKDIIKESPLTEFFDNIGIDLSIVDTKIELSGNKVSNILHEKDSSIITEYYRSIARGSPVSRRGLGTEREITEDFSDNINQLRVPGEGETGSYVAWLGNFNSGVSIPIKESSLVARKFYDLMEKKISEWKDSGLHRQDKYKAAIRRYNEFVKDTMEVKKNDSGELISVEYKNGGVELAQVASEDMSVMMTTLFGHETMGKNYWKSAVENWQDGSKFAHEVLRRFKLLTNRAHTKLSEDYTSDIIDFYENSKLIKESPAFENLRKKTLPIMKTLKKDGIKFHIVRDELTDGKMPKITSVLDQYNIQLQSEIKNRPGHIKKDSFKDLKEEDGIFTFGEGNDRLGDASQVNSVNIVSESTMEAIKGFLGFAHKRDMLHGKPIGAKTSTGETVMIDKTAFIVDKSWSEYLDNNKINGVMFTSALKTLGNKYNEKIIDFKDTDTMETFLKSDNTGKEVAFKLEDFSFGSLVKEKKDATVSLQVGSDLIGEAANDAFYNWIIGPKVKEYYKNVKPYASVSGVERESFVRGLFGEMYEKTGGNQTASLMETWMGKQGAEGGLPTFFPFKRSITNTIKKMYIDKAGIFSPRNEYGSQSVMAPSYFTALQDGHLRNSVFHYDRDGNRSLYTVGEIQIDKSNYHKSINQKNLHIIKNNKYGKDEILTWDDFADEVGLSKYEKKFFFGQALSGSGRSIGSIHQFLQLINSRKGKKIFVSSERVGWTKTLANKGLSLPNLKGTAMAILKSRKKDPVTKERDNKYVFLKSQINVDKLESGGFIEKDTKGGNRVKGGTYFGIDIVGDYYRFTDAMTNSKVRGKDIIIVDDILDAQSQMDAYKRGGAKSIYGVEWNKKFKNQLDEAEVKLQEGVNYQVSLIGSRNPSTRSSDKIILALKGFGLRGNQAIVNSIDSLTRMESDFDIDKVNYWWDTPTEVLREWESMQGNVAAVKPKSNPVSVDNLNFLNGNSLSNYVRDTERASLLKGIYVKSRRTLQWLSHYKGSEKDFNGMSFKSFDLNGKTVGVDQGNLKIIEKTIARDIQTILDSQKGWDIDTYNEKYMDKILFGDINNLTDYPGIFVRKQKLKVERTNEKTNETVTTNEWSNDSELVSVNETDAKVIKQMMAPYNRVLRLTSGLYESGARESVDYDTFLSYGKDYHWKMNNMQKYIFNRLRGESEQMEKQLQPLIKENNYFGTQIATPIIDVKPGKFITPTEGTGKGLLPFERALHLLTYQNRLTIPGAKKVPHELRKKIDSFISDLTTRRMERNDKTSYALKELHQMTRDDVDIMQSLNYLHSRRRNIQDRVHKNQYDNYWARQLESVNSLIEAQEQNINMSPKLQKMVAGKIFKQMIRNLKNGIPVNIRTKTGGVFTATSLKGLSYKQLRDSIWDNKNKKLYGRLVGTPSDDYVQMQAWYEIISSKVAGFGLNPEHFTHIESQEWQRDIRGIRKTIARKWGELYGQDAPSYHNTESIANDIQLELSKVYEKWNERYGIGTAALLTSTMPALDFAKHTYSNGRYGLAFFNSPAKEIKHINAVLRFLNSKESLTNLQGVELTGRDFIRRTAQEFTEVYNAFNKPVDMDVGFDNYALFQFDTPFLKKHGKQLLKAQDIDINNPTDFERMITELDGGGLEEKYRVLDNEKIENILAYNPEKARQMGLTGNLAYDYISLKNPGMIQGITPSLRALINMDFIPSRALTNRRRNVKISGLNHFYHIKQSDARMIFGSNADGKNLFTGEKQFVMRDIVNAENNINLSRSDLKDSTREKILEEQQGNDGRIC